MNPKSLFCNPVDSAVNLLSSIMPHDSALSEKAQLAITLMGAVLWADGKLEPSEVDSFREILSRRYSTKQVDKCVSILQSSKNIDLAEPCKQLTHMDITDDERNKFITALLELSFANNDFCQAQREMIETIADHLAISRETLESYIEAVTHKQSRKDKIVRSGTGIIVALVVIIIFILAATFLKAVVFGLILAYLGLPLEKFYERKFATNPVFLKVFYLVGVTFSPFKKLAEYFNRHKKVVKLSECEQAERQLAALVNKATTAAVGTFVIVAFMILIVVVVFSFNYANGMTGTVKSWMEENIHQPEQLQNPSPATKSVPVVSNTAPRQAAPAGTAQRSTAKTPASVSDSEKSSTVVTSSTKTSTAQPKIFLKKWVKMLDELKPKVEKIAIVKWGIEQVSQYLNNQENQKALIAIIMKKTLGVFSFTAGFVANIFSFLLEILLTIFFFSLLLNKMAIFNANVMADKNDPGDYLIKSLFDSKWMPKTSKATLTEAKRIINTIIEKLRTWLKGYMAIIAIETIVYIIGFSLIGVPHAIILGMLAGCTVLLPYIGPLASGGLTCLVCLAVGGDGVMVIIVLTIIFYMIMNGIVEQLFLYPTLVGEALELTTLETIIVVLLGGIFAGLFGMIFAVPTASVMKYLIPQIYRCWQRE